MATKNYWGLVLRHYYSTNSRHPEKQAKAEVVHTFVLKEHLPLYQIKAA